MESKLNDDVKLLTLIVRTRPFRYENETIICEYQSHTDIDDLKELRDKIQNEYDEMKDVLPHSDLEVLLNDIYILNTTIIELENLIK